MNNRKDFTSINTGGHIAHHSRSNGAEVRPAVSQNKATGEVPAEEGRAKASPEFKEIKPKVKASKQEEQAAIEDNTELVVETKPKKAASKIKTEPKKKTEPENVD